MPGASVFGIEGHENKNGKRRREGGTPVSIFNPISK
jgi:hypothetical protein